MRAVVFAFLVAVVACRHWWAGLSLSQFMGQGWTLAYPIIAKWSSRLSPGRTGGRLQFPRSVGASTMSRSVPVAGFSVWSSRRWISPRPMRPCRPRSWRSAVWTQFPIVMGGIAVVAHLDDVGAGQLRLSGPVLADIYLGKIAKWSDPAIKALNPDIELPDAGHRGALPPRRLRLDLRTSPASCPGSAPNGATSRRRHADKLAARTRREGHRRPGRADGGHEEQHRLSRIRPGRSRRASFVSLQNASGAFVAPAPDAFRARAGPRSAGTPRAASMPTRSILPRPAPTRSPW